MRLLGMPCGSSPILPEAWAPMGLKYRSSTAFQACGMQVRQRGLRCKLYVPPKSRAAAPRPSLLILCPERPEVTAAS